MENGLLYVAALALNLVLILALLWAFFSHRRIQNTQNQLALDARALEIRNDEMQKSNAHYNLENRKLAEDLSVAHTRLAVKNQQFEDLKLHITAQEQARAKDHEHFLHSAKQSVFEMAQTVSSKLLQDHKQENQVTRVQSEGELKKITQNLTQQLDTISQRVSSFDQTQDKVNMLERALSSPGMAGQASQTALGNMLAQMGLKAGRDYALEHHVKTETGSSLRPDAVLFLPGGAVFVIDSKSSKYLLEIAQAEQDEQADKEALNKQFLKTMRQHIKDLKSKDYHRHINDALHQAGMDTDTKLQTISTLMWLPNEGALERLERADPHFVAAAVHDHIFPVATNGLWAALGVAQFSIQLQVKEENLHHIARDIGALLETMRPMLEHADKLGKSLKSSLGHYDKFAGSINARVIPKARNLLALGVDPPKKGLPTGIELIAKSNPPIDLQSEEIGEGQDTDLLSLMDDGNARKDHGDE
ncbi:MAG: DNA recombination protein RmuC [Alphaproteobacteria bacterium]